MSGPDCYVGLMSGTSVDAVDAVVARFAGPSDRPEMLTTHSEAPPQGLREQLLTLSDADRRVSLLEFGRLDQAVGHWFASAANAAIAKAGLTASQIAAIGSHGQTIWHAPDTEPAFSLQIGAAPRIAADTGCAVVSDFRNADIALGGQGAPLVCAFHRALFAAPDANRVAVNIGGIANITLLPSDAHADPTAIRGFDTGPGNGLMDAWIQRHRGHSHDADGAWAASGRVDDELLAHLLGDDYFHREPPKSTGREYFGLDWLDRRVATLGRTPTPADVQATLCELTAITVADAVDRFGPGKETLYLCGGGVHNRYLVARIAALAAPRPVETTAQLGLDPDWIEALAFAWLARQRLLGRPGNAPGVTGASGLAVLGGWHAAPPAAPRI
ncbi:anhydro-N-acetylmuramic acid kinase [Salinisphaera sp. LB1]|uniref:anhydro-N-acetylmuramic acid kinase n=1 Tax=Salinisphaera sp. LB1 TaxID=2183911 RepID=UPI000D70738D|nr:anhydro-N-acetylmuramic acid kinase [Salinisphaera sp. LB1]AWN15909.1 Anhydro-N-acetylmuramic acid kinase [Salinisphaera sp. LB1]